MTSGGFVQVVAKARAPHGSSMMTQGIAQATEVKVAAVGPKRPPPKRRTAPPPLRPRMVLKPDGDDGGDNSTPRRPATQTHLPRLMGKPEVLRITGVTFPTLWRWMKEGKFPRSRALGGKSVWIENEIADWIANRPVILFKGEV
jgi:predicted DNA-binding transcriptional regulator AlpA